MSLLLFLKIALLAPLPLLGTKLSIPFFITAYPQVPIWFIIIATVAGDLIPVIFLLWSMPKIISWLHRVGARKLNRWIIATHDFLVRKDRITYLLITFLGINTAEWWLISKNHLPTWWYFFSFIISSALVVMLFLTTKKANAIAREEKNLVDWLYRFIHKQHGKSFYRWGSLLVLIICATPLPGAGSWTAGFVAFIFNIPFWRSVILTIVGVSISSGIIAGITTGVIDVVHYF